MNKSGTVCQGAILCSLNRNCAGIVYSLSVATAIAFRDVQPFDIVASCCHLQRYWVSFGAILGYTQTVGHRMDLLATFSVSPPAPSEQMRAFRRTFLFFSPGFPLTWRRAALAPMSPVQRSAVVLPASHLFPLHQMTCFVVFFL